MKVGKLSKHIPCSMQCKSLTSLSHDIFLIFYLWLKTQIPINLKLWHMICVNDICILLVGHLYGTGNIFTVHDSLYTFYFHGLILCFSSPAFSEGFTDVSDSCIGKGSNIQNSVTSTLALAGTDSSKTITPIPEPRHSSEPKCLSSLMTPDDFSSSNEKNDMEGTKTSPLLPVSA